MNLIIKACNKWVDDRAQVHGAALAFYSLFSLGPFLVIFISLAGWILGPNSIEIESSIQEFIGVEGAKAVHTLIVGANNQMASAAIFGLIILLFAASGVFSQLEDSLNLIWRAKPANRSGIVQYIRSKIFSFVLVFILGALLVLIFSLSAAISTLTRFEFFKETQQLVLTLELCFSFTVVTLVFSKIFKFIPSARVSFKASLVGGLVATTLIFIGKFLLELYFLNSNIISAYGIAASLIVLLLWIYYSAQIFLFGAEIAYLIDNP